MYKIYYIKKKINPLTIKKKLKNIKRKINTNCKIVYFIVNECFYVNELCVFHDNAINFFKQKIVIK